MQILSDYFADAMWNACNERITHAESAMAVGHAVVGPSFGEHLQLIKFVRHKAA